MRLPSLSVAQRVTLSFALLILLVLIASGSGLFFNQSVADNINATSVALNQITRAAEVENTWFQVVASTDYMLLTRQTTLIEGRLGEELAEFNRLMTELQGQPLGSSPAIISANTALGEDLALLANELNETVGRLFTLAQDGSWTRAQSERATELTSLQRRFSETLTQMRANLEADVNSSLVNARGLQDATRNGLVTISLLALFIGVAAGFVTSQGIVRPVSSLAETARAIQGGDFSRRAEVSQAQELGVMAEAFNSMTDQLRQSIDTLEARVEKRTRDLVDARKEAEAASQAKSTFLSNMSHELRTPLNLVIGYTSAMLDMPQMYANTRLPEVFRDDIRLIQDNSNHLIGLINDILDLSKIEAGRLELDPVAVELNEIFKGVIATSIGLVKDKPVQIRPAYVDNLPKVWADPLRTRQILLNLMSNAVKFTNTGSVTLSAQVVGNKMHIAISDTGMGIPEKSLADIFDRFKQIQNKSSVQGTGLGLDISQRLAQMHGSNITVQSVVGQGSTFSFELPLATAEQIDRSPVTLGTREGSVRVLQRVNWQIEQQKTIMIIEEDAEVRDLLHTTLEEAGYVVLDAQNAAQACDLASVMVPHLLIAADPTGATAGQTVARLRAESVFDDVPIIVLADDWLRAADEHHVTALSRNFRADELKNAVRAQLNSTVFAGA
jgi:signal transduction histidine kinase/CheY-like chemotaxis protein